MLRKLILLVIVASFITSAYMYTSFNKNDCWKVYPSGNESAFIMLCSEGG